MRLRDIMSEAAPMPRGMMEILWTTSVPGSAAATKACPISWCATISGRLVAASRTIAEAGSKPSISTSSWFSVCSFSS